MFRTTADTTVKIFLDVVNVPKGTSVMPVKGGDGVYYAVNNPEVLKQLNKHDRKYRYVYVPTELVEEVN